MDTSPWNLVHPRAAFWLHVGKPLRLLGLFLSAILFAGLAILTGFGALVALGKAGIGPMVELAAREREWSSVALGAGVAAIFAWLMWRSIKKQFRNLAIYLPVIEGRIESISEEDDLSDGGLGQYLSVKVRGKEYVLKYRLRRILKVGMSVRILLWPGTEETRAVRAVWVAW